MAASAASSGYGAVQQREASKEAEAGAKRQESQQAAAVKSAVAGRRDAKQEQARANPKKADLGALLAAAAASGPGGQGTDLTGGIDRGSLSLSRTDKLGD